MKYSKRLSHLSLTLITMFETSRDFLFWALGGAIVAVAVFICLLLFYLIRMARQSSKITDEAKKTIDDVRETVLTVKEKVKSFGFHIGMIAEIVKGVSEFLKERKAKKSVKSEEE